MRRTPIALIAACAVVLAGCGSDPHAGHSAAHAGHNLAPTTPASAQAPVSGAAGATPAVSDYNLGDVMFLQMAIANHQRGIDLVHLADNRPIRDDLHNLITAIRLTQEQEIPEMKKWLTGWGQSTDVDPNPNAHAAHGGMPITDPQTLADLANLPDNQFQKQFIVLLTAHQHNAVEFALTENKEGVSVPVKAFADKLIKSRTGEIQQLLNLEQ
ncbi:DUF305 domain-containing protein [Actinokineospora inagensis]|uniref:DUF305 domain-containing protein n=1 Tax=Actinokineospora inagensis TaxID=103730 RepID=UPI00040F5A65|nr:DUF305 domain-containing protein [Actinokineospora inagensis]